MKEMLVVQLGSWWRSDRVEVPKYLGRLEELEGQNFRGDSLQPQDVAQM